MNNLQCYFLPFALLLILLEHRIVHPQIISLPQSNVVDASSGLVFRYLSNYLPADNVVSFTVAFPMTWDLCYLIPLHAFRKIPACSRPVTKPSNYTLRRHRQFLPELISIGISSAALALSTHNSLQILRLYYQIQIVRNSLSSLTNVANTATTHLLHLRQGQLKLAQSLNHTQIALNQTINLVNEHSIILGQHATAIEHLASFARLMDYKLNTFMHLLKTHFIESSLSDILAHQLNLRFIHHKDLPGVLDYIVRTTNTSFNLNLTQLSLLELISRLLIQQHINFLPTVESFIHRNSVIGTLYVSLFFVATTNTNNTFSLYELLAIPFQYHNTRIRLADIPYMIGIDFKQARLITWTSDEADICDFKAMFTCRETPAILTHWHDTCIFQILYHANLSSCRTAPYPDPLFIHRIGNQWAISTNNSLHCHSTSLSPNTHAFKLLNTLRLIPAVAVISIPPGTTLLCDRFSISALPTDTTPFLSILDSSLIDTSDNDTVDLVSTLTNSTRWRKLPSVSNNLQSIINYINNTQMLSPILQNQTFHHHLVLYALLCTIAVAIILLAFFFYWNLLRKPCVPSISFQLPSFTTSTSQ